MVLPDYPWEAVARKEIWQGRSVHAAACSALSRDAAWRLMRHFSAGPMDTYALHSDLRQHSPSILLSATNTTTTLPPGPVAPIPALHFPHGDLYLRQRPGSGQDHRHLLPAPTHNPLQPARLSSSPELEFPILQWEIERDNRAENTRRASSLACLNALALLCA
jgi:hypothetical protein